MICPHCQMLTVPMGLLCEFCGENVKAAKKEEVTRLVELSNAYRDPLYPADE